MKEFIFQVLKESNLIPERVWDDGLLLLVCFPIAAILFFTGYKKLKADGHSIKSSWEQFPLIRGILVIAYLMFASMLAFIILSSIILHYLR